ncbi:hypothetical protein DL546_005542 [Coniochaeta pulveracea]|uniref:Uncharacterized protein n=1 Tax=Coniochaeta pulveracea TaxID=177199 RepID=A0A420Y786_9PEZI|nr:hypothetical protein DL546_005542 [Coniochaeta pulveracea]
MDDPASSWPFWKFGFKKDDLVTTLHDQYNTYPIPIQDPEAFHHDVFECSQEAGTTEDFHRLLASRKEQRLRELNGSLESAALEIIANPGLIGTEQWQYALQLFRTKSLDSLVRYFSSYLPDSHPWYKSETDATLVGFDDDGEHLKSKIHSDEVLLFDDRDEELIITHEPLPLSNIAEPQLPPSPRSMTMCSNASSTDARHVYGANNVTLTRTPSLSGSESGLYLYPSRLEGLEHFHDDDTSQPDDPETPLSEYSDGFSETAFSGISEKYDGVEEETQQEGDMDATASKLPIELESDTPTPKPETHSSVFFAPQPSAARARECSFSPSRSPASVRVHCSFSRDEQFVKSAAATLRRRDHSQEGSEEILGVLALALVVGARVP